MITRIEGMQERLLEIQKIRRHKGKSPLEDSGCKERYA
jgi:hypothetical protein